MKNMGSFSVVIIFIAITTVRSGAQSSHCNKVILELASCLSYIQGNATAPSAGCCTQLANIVKTQPTCLCQLVTGGGGSSTVGIAVNQTLALALPKACNVNTPSVSLCNVNATSPLTPSSEGGSNVTPPQGGDSSDGFSVQLMMPFSIQFIITNLLAIVLYPC